MNDYPPAYLRLRKSDPRYEHEIRRYFQGTYQSNWNFLVSAAQSDLLHAAVQTAKVVESYRTAVERNQRPAETYFATYMNYSRLLSGPLLGTVLSSAAALEGFLRAVARAYHERELPKDRRAGGTSKTVLSELSKFDGLPVLAKPAGNGKLGYLFQALLNCQCPRELGDEVGHLVTFRNSCFHADPVLRLQSGADETTKKGRVRHVGLSHGRRPEYPLLWRNNWPLSLSHALRAARTHDGVVKELTGSGALGYVRDALEIENDLGLNMIDAGWAFPPEALDRLAEDWDRLDRELAAVSDEDRRIFVLEVNRKLGMHAVK